ncbi:MAG TPA: cytochrome c [Noviherbaspirillum sp.]|nr:cytochrome c [Noviherbaspirillum sp.]
MNISRLGAFLIPLSVFAISPVHAEPASARQTELLYLVRQDCGSCHGLRMEGGLGVPLTPMALKGKDVEGLKLTILQGRPGTTMPPWNPFISEAEAGWIVDMLIKGLPDAH